MRKWRRKYYDLFAKVYDQIIALHSQDKAQRLRFFLLEKAGVKKDSKLLDLCTGTGAVCLAAAQLIGPEGLIVGVDFSWGMLKQAQKKAQRTKPPSFFLVLADVGRLPFGDRTFDVVTCSHAMYELDPQTREATLREIKRVLKPSGCFAMMEHNEPRHPVIRLFYYLRLLSMGTGDTKAFAKNEIPYLKRHFRRVEKFLSPTGNSKLLLAYV